MWEYNKLYPHLKEVHEHECQRRIHPTTSSLPSPTSATSNPPSTLIVIPPTSSPHPLPSPAAATRTLPPAIRPPLIATSSQSPLLSSVTRLHPIFTELQ